MCLTLSCSAKNSGKQWVKAIGGHPKEEEEQVLRLRGKGKHVHFTGPRPVIRQHIHFSDSDSDSDEGNTIWASNHEATEGIHVHYETPNVTKATDENKVSGVDKVLLAISKLSDKNQGAVLKGISDLAATIDAHVKHSNSVPGNVDRAYNDSKLPGGGMKNLLGQGAIRTL